MGRVAPLMISFEAPADAASPLVAVENLHKTFGPKVVLTGVNWTIPRGQISGLLGPNGAG